MWKFVACFGFGFFSVTGYDKYHYIYVSNHSQTCIIAVALYLKLLCRLSKAFVTYQRYCCVAVFQTRIVFLPKRCLFFIKLRSHRKYFTLWREKKNSDQSQKNINVAVSVARRVPYLKCNRHKVFFLSFFLSIFIVTLWQRKLNQCESSFFLCGKKINI